MAMEMDNDLSARVRLESDMRAQPYGKRLRADQSHSPFCGSAQISRPRLQRIELVFFHRRSAPTELHRYVVEPASREPAIEMTQSRNDHPGDRRFEIGAGLIEY